MFRLIRLILDARDLRSSFPTYSLYCDWLQHTELDRNPGVLPLMEALDSIFFISLDSADFNIDLKTILDALGLVILRRELLDQFNQLSRPTSLLTGMSNWYTTVSVRVEDLVGRPLIFTIPPARKAGKDSLARTVARRRAAGAREDRHIYKVVISDERTKTPQEGRPAGFYFTVFLSPGEPDRMQFNGHWAFQEGRSAFTRD